MNKHYDPKKDLQRQDYSADPKDEVKLHNSMDIEAVLDKIFGNCADDQEEERSGD